MIALVMLLGQATPATLPTDQMARSAWRSDQRAFSIDEDNLGIRRIPPMKINGGPHYSSSQWPVAMAKFLVGNKTDRPTKTTLRSMFLPRHAGYSVLNRNTGKRRDVPADTPPKDYSEARIMNLVAAHFGSDFSDKKGTRDVYGFQVRAEEKCLKCHTWAKTGDSLGYMVYAIDRK